MNIYKPTHLLITSTQPTHPAGSILFQLIIILIMEVSSTSSSPYLKQCKINNDVIWKEQIHYSTMIQRNQLWNNCFQTFLSMTQNHALQAEIMLATCILTTISAKSVRLFCQFTTQQKSLAVVWNIVLSIMLFSILTTNKLLRM